MSNKLNTEETINKAVKQAIKEFDKEKRQEQKKKVFHNTKLLLKHYNDLKQHVENAIDDVRRLETDLEELGDLEKDELYILSIKRSKSKTLIMIAHVDMAMDTLRQKQIKLCSIEKYQALKMFYIDELSYEDIVKHFNCGVNTPRRWMNDMINELSILLFGIDGLKLDVV
jgi:beta-phosphoglucomutase-like phosphatase (HAD superfamily)